MSDDQVNSWKVIAAYHAPEPEPELPPDTHCPHGVNMDPKLDLQCHYCDEDRVSLLRSWVEARHFLWHSDDVKFLLERSDRFEAHSVTLNTVGWRLHDALGVIPEGATRYDGPGIEEDLAEICDLIRAGREYTEKGAAIVAMIELVTWLSDLDAPGSDARGKVTLTQICNKAREALARRWATDAPLPVEDEAIQP